MIKLLLDVIRVEDLIFIATAILGIIGMFLAIRLINKILEKHDELLVKYNNCLNDLAGCTKEGDE